MYPKKKWLKPKEKASNAPEAALQKQLDDYLAIKGVRYIRISDSMFKWLRYATLKLQAHGVWAWIAKTFGGLPDNLLLVKISDKYLLATGIELKTKKGALHGKQKHMAEELSYQISKSPEKSMEIVEAFLKEAERLKTLI